MSRKVYYYKGPDLHFGATPVRLENYVHNYKGPIIVYDANLIKERIGWIQKWPDLGRLHYAVKANFNLDVLKIFNKADCGLDVVSVGEMKQGIKAGFKPKDFIFSGVAKSEDELKWSIANKIYQINVESISELKKILKLAEALKTDVDIALRINPEIDAETHPSISTALRDSKFGLDFEISREAVQLLKGQSRVQLKALSFHLGSQIMNVKVFEKALKTTKPFFKEIQKLRPELDRLDLGGGLGIDYKNADGEQDQKRWEALQAVFTKELKDVSAKKYLEVGRFLVARSGILISKVEVIKKTSYNKKFLILDAGMTHIMRPALYQAYHEIIPLKLKGGMASTYDIVGPICESTDVLATKKRMTAIDEGDFVAICDVGAYGSSMASDYNLRERAKEIFI